MSDTVASRSTAPSSPRGAALSEPDYSAIDNEVALRESEAHYRVPWTADADGTVLDFSDRWLELTGLPAHPTLEGGWTQAGHSDDIARVMETWRRSVDTVEPYDVEYRLRLADGSERWVRVRAFPQRDEQGAVLRWYGFIEDVHDYR